MTEYEPGDALAITASIPAADHDRTAYTLAVVQDVDENYIGLSVVVSRELLDQWDVKKIKDWGE